MRPQAGWNFRKAQAAEALSRKLSSWIDDALLRPTAEEAEMDPNLMMKVIGERAPARGLPVRHPLMHRTRTVDYALSDEIDMMFEDSVVDVAAGDVIVQQATNHAWINRGTQPCRILFALIDSRQP
jgi:hypothetical protein